MDICADSGAGKSSNCHGAQGVDAYGEQSKMPLVVFQSSFPLVFIVKRAFSSININTFSFDHHKAGMNALDLEDQLIIGELSGIEGTQHLQSVQVFLIIMQ